MLLSIRLQTYNHQEFIEQALQGIEDQITNFNFEVVIGDDFSTDNNVKLIKKFISNSKNSKIEYRLLDRKEGDAYWKQRQKKGRLYNFINILENCKGKYIALLDGDDYWTGPLKLQKQVDFLEANEGFSGCFHDTLILNETQSDSILKAWRVYDKDIFKLEDTISTTALCHTSSFMFKKSDFYLPTWFTKVQSGDMALFALVASNGKLYRVNEFMSVYRKNEAGLTNFISLKDYHKNRIKLNLYYKESFGVNTHEKIDEVINYHNSELIKLKRWFDKIKDLFKL